MPNCDVKGCLNPVDATFLPCSNPNCEKQVHRYCFENKVCKSAKCDKEDANQYCSVKCKEVYDKGNAALSLGWRNNGPKGQENSNMSEKELVLWLSNEENYARYRGGT